MPSRFHVAPRPAPTTAMDSTAPPLAGILESPVSVVTKPIQRPSADQNGFLAPSVPARSCAADWSSARAARTTRPSTSRTGKMTRVPSGESASGPDSGSRDHPSGATSEDTILRTGGLRTPAEMDLLSDQKGCDRGCRDPEKGETAASLLRDGPGGDCPANPTASPARFARRRCRGIAGRGRVRDSAGEPSERCPESLRAARSSPDRS